VQKILFDPWQMQSVAQRLLKRGLPIEEFPQTSPNLTSASQNLFDLIESLGLVMYPDEQLRLAISRAVAIETPRGWRIGKHTQSHKIDLVISLAMACHAAMSAQKEPFFDRSWSWVNGEPIAGGDEDYDKKLAREAEANAQWRQSRYAAYVLSGGFLR
jgi:phage terminase large subunit-like protein